MRTHQLSIGKLHIRFNLFVALAVLLCAGGLARLGIWQLSRAAEKIAEQQAYTESGLEAATPINEVPLAGLEFDMLQHQNRHVSARGHYLNDKNIFLIYQTFEEQPGFEVITPFALDDDERIILVSRGWSGINQVDDLAVSLETLEGTRLIEGQIYVPTAKEAARINSSQNRNFPLLRRYLHPDELQPLFDAELFPYVIRLAEGEPGLLVRHWPQVSVATDKHFSYALQWFAMSIAVLATAFILSSNIRQLIRAPID